MLFSRNGKTVFRKPQFSLSITVNTRFGEKDDFVHLEGKRIDVKFNSKASTMPTLMFVPESHATAGDAASATNNNRNGDDGSTTIYNSDESTIFDEDHAHKGSTNKNEKGSLSEIMVSPILRDKRNNKSVTFDESLILLSTGKKGRYSRRDTLNSDVSLLSCDTIHARDRSILTTQSNNSFSHNSEKQNLSVLSRDKSDRVRPWPRRDEYNEKYQHYVKTTISKFHSKFQGKLRDYRIMSLEEKTQGQQNVLALLTRLGVSKNDFGSNSMVATSPSVHAQSSFKSPVSTSRRLIDDSLSPMFSPNPEESGRDNLVVPSVRLSGEQNNENEQNSVHLNQSKYQCEKSELLLSMDDGDVSGVDPYHRNEEKLEHSVDKQDPSRNDDDDDFEFPVNNDEDDITSNGSMELVRKAALDDTHYSDKRLSCMTPERKIRKRGASSSGKRGEDLRRSRLNEQEDQYAHLGHQRGDEVEISARFGRLSISPSLSTPPKDLFITSQSPISPRLTYHSPDNKESDDYSDKNYMKRISLGRDSNECRGSNRRDSRRNSNVSNDSLATYTPPLRYRSEKEKRRAFREVPVNVVLKKGATFHLEKIAVKRTERISSKSATLKGRRLVNFPDPLVRYGSRRRRALKEMYSCVRRAELDYEEGRCIIPAVGAFFSLSEQQIIDVSLKLFLSDYAEKSQETKPQNSQSTLALKGNTLVVVRTKDDTANWESALREGTGCAVLNHSSLPLSERIRASTSEMACLYDVVLTTYDAMKSPDITIPVTNAGRAILTKSDNDGGWNSSRNASQQEHNKRQQTKKLSVLHRIQFKRIIFVDTLGRKCYTAKSGTTRAAASVALSSSSCRLVFFKETEADGSNALLALRKSDKRSFQSVSSVLHLTDYTNESTSSDMGNTSSDDEDQEDPLENIAMDLKDLVS
jgi:hypothetical protein